VLRGFFAFAVCFAILFWVGTTTTGTGCMAYMLIWPLQVLNGRITAPRIRAELNSAEPYSRR
jgi:hypothetical protein